MTKPMTLTDLKRELKKLDHAELIDLISMLYKSNDKTKEFLNTRFIGEEYQLEVLVEYKKKMHDEFYPRSKKMTTSLKAAKSLITEFKKIGSFEMTLDLMLYYVECGTEVTNDYGDVDGPFYSSLCSVFEQFVDQLNLKGTQAQYFKFRDRIDQLIVSSSNIGWGFGDCISDISLGIEWFFEDQEE